MGEGAVKLLSLDGFKVPPIGRPGGAINRNTFLRDWTFI
jgi:hypothetical protein